MNYKETYNQGYENGYKDAKSNLLGREGKIVDCDFKNICSCSKLIVCVLFLSKGNNHGRQPRWHLRD